MATATASTRASVLVACLMQIQLMRRYYECLFVERPSPTARMHIGHYAVGISYYIATCMAIWCHDQPAASATSAGWLPTILALSLFAYASIEQYRCHAILGQLRATQPGTYAIPYGGWFSHVSSPHYLAELLIYTALAMLLRFPWTWCCLLAWVVVNLGTTARQTHRWYRRQFRDYPAARTAFIPKLY
ncbi:3-oxo-5-alpha-steroid 4-dehydrogenase-domain-containing protein [Syncephalis pseudoplumigaleata]|uniref:3-oxo-5-alpha-steroid 4-dehydrogenase-domain-containing protein n=1 Tax=Syncephalis pseudoplumigaleata TaxID=1712513 RepID=A0A4P9YXT3_9FUNG|nr:3-oxo-5-alpha-steroid 4-dehydrogenase-domain-containing protein [Syncephalis pseudoplumigaleata]|eukprot:RKP24715.1 3-oxo-5-alpha-steroid 4-dehydrogenase-domain-containing protein [Syncephalis pseudoplumigaleata]